MSLLYIDGFDHYASTAQMPNFFHTRLWGLNAGLGTPGRSGSGKYLHWNDWGAIGLGFSGWGTPPWTSIAGLSVRLASLDQFVLATVVVPREQSPKRQIGLYVASDGSLEVWTMVQTPPYKGTLLATSAPGLFAPNVWRHLEWKCLLDAADGLYAARLDGTPLCSSTGRTVSDDQPFPDEPPYIAFPTALDIDDLYLANTAGPGIADFLGIRQVRTLTPESDVATGWTPSVPGPHAPLVAQLAPEDLTYISDTTSGTGDTDAFRFPAPPASGVDALQVTMRLKSTNENAAGARPVIGSGTGAVLFPLWPEQFQPLTQVWEKDATGTPWTSGSVAATTFGVRAICESD